MKGSLMNLIVHDTDDQRFIEGVPGQPLISRVEDVARVVEACFEHAVDKLLLYPDNLTEHFFDLSSREAGAILQKLRAYHIRLAVVRSPGLQLSRRFGEMLADEQQGSDFRLFTERSAAQAWFSRA